MSKEREERQLIQGAISDDLFGPEALSEPAELAVPDKYALVRFLGRGGAGVVWLARDTTLDRDVALKFLTEARRADVERFRREARFTAWLNDPSIVKVYELGEEDGQPYIAMQYVDGGNLGDADLDWNELVGAMVTVAGALGLAHQAGIVHRDIKPENILLDGEGRAYLTDFGLARDMLGRDALALSQEGVIMGTPALMPPEQARGDLSAIDARSDVYALGATCFRLLTGRPPFDGDSMVELLHAVLKDQAPLLRSFNPGVPRALEAFVDRCLSKRRADRYGSMEEVVAALGSLEDAEPGPAASAPWFRRLVGAPESPAGAEESDELWPQAMETAREIADWDASLYRVTTDIRRTWPPLDDLIARLDTILEDRPDVAWARFYRGAALHRRGRIALGLEEMERSIDRMAHVPGAHFELGRACLAAYLREHLRAERHLSRVGTHEHQKDNRGRLDEAVVAFEEARRRQRRLPAWQADYAGAVTHLAEGDPAACVSACDEILGNDPDIEEVWKLRGDAQRLAGEDPTGSYERAVTVRRSFHEALTAMAEAQFHRGDLAAAQSSLDRAVSIHPESAEAGALSARIRLESARVEGGSGLDEIQLGIEAAERSLEADAGNYEAAVSLIELLLEQSRREGEPSLLNRALESVASAKRMTGCRNRVQLLEATVLLERARQTAASGGDPAADFAAVRKIADEEGALVPDNEPWRAVLEAVRDEQSRMGP